MTWSTVLFRPCILVVPFPPSDAALSASSKEGIKGNCDNAKIPGFSNTYHYTTTTLVLHLITPLQFD
jgi:hypothetical protein